MARSGPAMQSLPSAPTFGAAAAGKSRSTPAEAPGSLHSWTTLRLPDWPRSGWMKSAVWLRLRPSPSPIPQAARSVNADG